MTLKLLASLRWVGGVGECVAEDGTAAVSLFLSVLPPITTVSHHIGCAIPEPQWKYKFSKYKKSYKKCTQYSCDLIVWYLSVLTKYWIQQKVQLWFFMRIPVYFGSFKVCITF